MEPDSGVDLLHHAVVAKTAGDVAGATGLFAALEAAAAYAHVPSGLVPLVSIACYTAIRLGIDEVVKARRRRRIKP